MLLLMKSIGVGSSQSLHYEYFVQISNQVETTEDATKNDGLGVKNACVMEQSSHPFFLQIETMLKPTWPASCMLVGQLATRIRDSHEEVQDIYRHTRTPPCFEKADRFDSM